MNPRTSILAPSVSTTPHELGARRAQNRRRPFRAKQRNYDAVVIGSGLGGLTCANRLAASGYSVLVLEQHYNFGGLATWFKRKGGHVFDISLHGFPVGMKKTCRKYWSQEIADLIVQIRDIRFSNPQFTLQTTFDRPDFERLLTDVFHIERSVVTAFFETVRGMNFFDDQSMSTRELFQTFFPGRTDVWRLLLEPIAYANGSTLDDPALTYGIVFSNFMQKGVYTFVGGTDHLIHLMKRELTKHGVELRNHAEVERIVVDASSGHARVTGVIVDGQWIPATAVVSNANLIRTIFNLVGGDTFDSEFLTAAREVRLNHSSCQVYLGLRPDAALPCVGDLCFVSSAPLLDSTALRAKACTSRTYSFYYPWMRPKSQKYSIVCSTNANYNDWACLSPEAYQDSKESLARESIDILSRFVPGIEGMLDHVEVATPRTFEFFTQHLAGASFGTKFEGLKISQELPKQVGGLFHAGSVGIIMSGWLGAANYGVIVANEVDRWLGATGARRGMVAR